MEMWTQSQAGAWNRWEHVGLGLDALATSDSLGGIVVVGEHPSEDPTLIAVIRLVRRLATGPVQVIAGSEHPSASWRESVREAGADKALLVSRLGELCWRDEPPIESSTEIGPDACPALRARQTDGITVSVCAHHTGVMVLAPRHFRRWCFANKEQCPHWQGSTGGRLARRLPAP